MFTGCRWKDIIYKFCLPHDLCYTYGTPANEIERQQIDKKFYSDLMNKAGMNKFLASAFFAAVRIGGKEEFGLSLSWGLPIKRPFELGWI